MYYVCWFVVAALLRPSEGRRVRCASVVAKPGRPLVTCPLACVRTPVRHIMRKYSDLPADFAVACLIHLADELNTGEILTFEGDFAHYRWRKTRRFHLLRDVQ